MQNEYLLLEAARKADEQIQAQIERARQLEQLVKEGIEDMERFAYATDVRVWIARAKALLEQEVK